MQEGTFRVFSCLPGFLISGASICCAPTANRAYPPTFPMRTKRRFCRKAMSRRRLRRARELLAQIVRFEVEIVCAPVGEYALGGANRNAQPAAIFMTRFDIEMIMLAFSRRGELRSARREMSKTLPQPGAGAHAGLHVHKYMYTGVGGQGLELESRL